MQVTQVDDRITNAALGGQKSQAFEIAQTAEFFRIMSSSLYSNKKLAVIRETMCNAWDAHVEAGCTDIPVQITLTSNHLTIRDFGNGIHPDKIGPIYGTYGGSTKKNNENVTGGFGLGCKAPFAVVDHFEVTSFHGGTKTIYDMALSSGEVEGKPGIKQLVQVPTSETGLQVVLDIPANDQNAYEVLIRRIAAAGEMKIELNGQLLKVLPFSEAKDGFLLVKDVFVEAKQSHIHIRYGHVIYPVTDNEVYSSEFVRVKNILTRLSQYNHWRDNHFSCRNLVLQAAPNSLSVTPSRETLEMTEKTANAVKALLIGFIDGFSSTLSLTATRVAEQSIDTIWLSDAPKSLFHVNASIPNLRSQQGKLLSEVKVFSNYADVSRQHLAHHYPQGQEFPRKDLRLRIDALVRSGFDTTGLARKFRLDLVKNQGDISKGWFAKHVAWPLIRALKKEPLLEADWLKVYTGNKDWQTGLATLLDPKRYTPGGAWTHLPFLRNIVVLAHNRKDIVSRPNNFPIVKYWLGDVGNGCLTYIVPRNVKRAETAKALFEKRGFHVIDLTQYQSWETPPEKKVSEAVVKRKPKTGVAVLSSIINPNGQLEAALAYKDDTPRTKTPEFYVQVSAQTNNIGFDPVGSGGGASAVVRLFGKKGGIVSNGNQALKLLGQGIPHLEKWLPAQLKEAMLNNPKLDEYFAYSLIGREKVGLITLSKSQKNILRALRQDKELSKHFGLPDSLPQQEKDLITVYTCYSSYRITQTPELKEIQDHLKSLKLSKLGTKLETKIGLCLLLDQVSTTNFDWLLKDSTREKQTRKLILHLLGE